MNHSSETYSQLFARKLIRSFSTTENYIPNELRAVDKLCGNVNDHIVTMYRHGGLPNLPYYFIDMEFCEE